jgi:ribonucleoside-triphosphate reductase (formate)
MVELKRQKCEIFSRVVGYVRRIDAWNYGKKAEFHDRKLFSTDIKDENRGKNIT